MLKPSGNLMNTATHFQSLASCLIRGDALKNIFFSKTPIFFPEINSQSVTHSWKSKAFSVP